MKKFRDLKVDEMRSIYGGESFWYRVGQGVGYLAGKINPANWPGRITPERGGNATWAEK